MRACGVTGAARSWSRRRCDRSVQNGISATLIPMANLTITIDDELLRRARLRALEQGTSVNALLRDYLTASGLTDTFRRTHRDTST